MTTGVSGNERRQTIAANLAALRERVGAAASAAGRSLEEITLVAVTKGFPAVDVEHLMALGITDIGENKDQEARDKLSALLPELHKKGVRTHFIGQLQTNKCRSVVGYSDVVQAVDRLGLVAALSKACATAQRRIAVLLQVNLDEALLGLRAETSGGRGGVDPAGVAELAEAVASSDFLTLGGVMAVAPLGGDATKAFEQLRGISARLRENYPAAKMISAGMSGDFELAIAHGATHIRLGSALLGHR